MNTFKSFFTKGNILVVAVILAGIFSFSTPKQADALILDKLFPDVFYDPIFGGSNGYGGSDYSNNKNSFNNYYNYDYDYSNTNSFNNNTNSRIGYSNAINYSYDYGTASLPGHNNYSSYDYDRYDYDSYGCHSNCQTAHTYNVPLFSGPKYQATPQYHYNHPVPSPSPTYVPYPSPSPYPVPVPYPKPYPVPQPYPQPYPVPQPYPQPYPIPQPYPVQQPIYIPQPQPIVISQPQPIIVTQPQPIIVTQAVSYPARLTVRCSPNVTTSYDIRFVTWTAYASGGRAPYTYSWSGTEYTNSASISSDSIYVYYPTYGQKYMSVNVQSADGYVASATCGPVNIIDP